jgi:hypothetical protein
MWFGPLLLTMLFNVVVYILCFIQARKRVSNALSATAKERHSKTSIYAFRKISLFILVSFIVWTPDLVNHVIQMIPGSCEVYWLWVLQSMLSPLQGFLNFIVYALLGGFFRVQAATRNDTDILPDALLHPEAISSSPASRLLTPIPVANQRPFINSPNVRAYSTASSIGNE